VSKVPSLATRREHLTQSVVGTFAPYPKIRARGQMTQLETFAIKAYPQDDRLRWAEERLGSARRRDTSTTSRSKARMGSMRPVLIF